MKTLILIVLLALSFWATGQTKVKEDAQGNYTAITATKTGSNTTETGKVFIDKKGIKYPVLLSKNGKLFYVRTSKSGNKYNVYLTETK